MQENESKVLVGLADGRIIEYIVGEDDASPKLTELTPKRTNINFEAIKMVTIKDFACIGSANGSVNIWSMDDGSWEHLKTLELKGKKEYGKKWEVVALDVDDKYLYTGGPTGFIEIWDPNADFEKVGDFQINTDPVRGLHVNSKAIFLAAGEAMLSVVQKDDYGEIYTERYPWAKYRINTMAVNENFLCVALTGRVFAYQFNEETMQVRKYAEFPNTHNKVKDLCLYFNLCYSAPWDGQLRAWNILSKNPNPILSGSTGSLESICVDRNYIYIGSHHGRLTVLDKMNGNKTKHVSEFGSAVQSIYR